MMPEYNGKPSEGLARLRQVKTGAVPALFHHKEFGDIGIMYGKAGDPNNNYRHGYGLAHIDAKHPGAADTILAFFDGPDVRELEPTVGENGRKDAGRVVLSNKKYRLAMTRNFTKGRNPSLACGLLPRLIGSRWVKAGHRAQSPPLRLREGATHRPLNLPQQKIARPTGKKDLSKHKGKLSQGSKGDFFPENG